MEALLLTQEKIVRWLEEAGWWVAAWAGEEALVGYSDGDLLILAHESEIRTADPTFELYDGRRGLSYRVRVIPTPRVAARLLEQQGEPFELLTCGQHPRKTQNRGVRSRMVRSV